MGVDIYVLIRKNKETKREKETHSPFGRGLGSVIQNAYYGDNQILSKVEIALGLDLSFLLSPDYFNYQFYTDQIDYQEDKEKKQDMIKAQEKLDNESEDSWINIDVFLSKLEILLNTIELKPEYYKNIDYNRRYWQNYLDNGEFKEELLAFKDFLISKKNNNYSLFTFDIL